jgi:hypothetical protein
MDGIVGYFINYDFLYESDPSQFCVNFKSIYISLGKVLEKGLFGM